MEVNAKRCHRVINSIRPLFKRNVCHQWFVERGVFSSALSSNGSTRSCDKSQFQLSCIGYIVKMLPFKRGVKFSSGSYSISKFSNVGANVKPKASEVLTAYLKLTQEPPWTSYFVKCMDVVNDQYGMSHFNWQVGQSNYTVLRVGCFPFIKYHCTRSPRRNLEVEDKFFRFIKAANLGIPCLLYGIAALFLIRHKELVHLESGSVYIYFLMKENLGSPY